MEPTKYIWHNGEIVDWQDATVHVTAHALHYGSSVFEGVRAYDTSEGAQFFRLGCHTKRLYTSAKLYRIDIPHSGSAINEACHAVVSLNGLDDGAYIRPIVFRGCGGLGLGPGQNYPVEASVMAFRWGAYLGEESLQRGVDVCVSSWNRVAPNTIPGTAKAGGNYLSSQLVAMEAHRLGFDEGIALSVDGRVSEGAGENLFLVRDGQLFTPPTTASILAGITRDTVMVLARSLGYEVIEREFPREMLYLADELFFTGTAAEITPIRSVDGLEIGAGQRGPVTRSLQDTFFGLFAGTTPDRWGWLEPVRSDFDSVSLAI